MNLVADTSAFVAILLKESDADSYRNTLLSVEKVLISAATAVELHIVVTAKLARISHQYKNATVFSVFASHFKKIVLLFILTAANAV